MHTPKVTFIIPCYKLAHLLKECVTSILAQTYGDFEVLIMDDCSPDNTPEVAASFRDPRVKHIRNEPNLGHLRNYNKAIELAAGEYLWLISADDRLRQPHVLERYLDVMEAKVKAQVELIAKIRAGEDSSEWSKVRTAGLNRKNSPLIVALWKPGIACTDFAT